MKVLLISLLLVCSLGGKVCLPKGWILEWTFYRTSEIGFKLTIDEHTWENYGWVGIGIKEASAAVGMVGSDITNIIIGGEKTDRFSTVNGLPQLDVELGGTDDILNPTERFENGQHGFTWTKKMDTLDRYDTLYVQGRDYNLLWACGDVMNGVQMKHFTVDRDRLIITLDEDYEKDCEDSEPFLMTN